MDTLAACLESVQNILIFGFWGRWEPIPFHGAGLLGSGLSRIHGFWILSTPAGITGDCTAAIMLLRGKEIMGQHILIFVVYDRWGPMYPT